MRKLCAKAWITLDGVFDAEATGCRWQNTNGPKRMRYITEEYSNGDAFLSGRATYAMLWPGWSKQTTGDGLGSILNRMHKYVVSAALPEAPWRESVIIFLASRYATDFAGTLPLLAGPSKVPGRAAQAPSYDQDC